MKVGYINILPKKYYRKATEENGLVSSDKCQNCNEWSDEIYWVNDENKNSFMQQKESAHYDGYIQANKLCEKCYKQFAREDRSQTYMLQECIEI